MTWYGDLASSPPRASGDTLGGLESKLGRRFDSLSRLPEKPVRIPEPDSKTFTERPMTDLTCVIVHWNLPQLLAECLQSLLPEIERLETCGITAEVIVVDNRSSEDARAALREMNLEQVSFRWRESNAGYSTAARQAYAESEAPLVLVANPDLLFLPGSLPTLVAAMEEADVGIAGPHFWWDRDRTLRLYPSLQLNRESIEYEAAVRRSNTWPAYSLRWLEEMTGFWRASEPRDMPCLSGACMLVRRTAVDAVGGLLDPNFFLYYEDTDLSERVLAGGYRLLYEPGAEVIHLYNQSRQPDVVEQMGISKRRYLEKHYGSEEADRLIRVHEEAAAAEGDFVDWNLIDLGKLEAPPSFLWESNEESVFTLGANPQVVPAAGAFLEERCYTISPALWEQMTPGTYYVRVTGRSSQTVLKYWRFQRP